MAARRCANQRDAYLPLQAPNVRFAAITEISVTTCNANQKLFLASQKLRAVSRRRNLKSASVYNLC